MDEGYQKHTVFVHGLLGPMEFSIQENSIISLFILHDPHLDLKAHRAVVRVVAPVPISGEMIGEGMALSQMVLGIPLKGIRKLRDADSMP